MSALGPAAIDDSMSARATVLGRCPSHGAVFLRQRADRQLADRRHAHRHADRLRPTGNSSALSSRRHPSGRAPVAVRTAPIASWSSSRRGPNVAAHEPAEVRHGRHGGAVRCGGADEEAEAGAVELAEVQVVEIKQAEDVEDVEVEEEVAVKKEWW